MKKTISFALTYGFLIVLLFVPCFPTDGSQTLDSFNRSNYAMLANFQRMSGSRYQDPRRRYASGSSNFRSSQERPAGQPHFTDPLFGSTVNSSNAMPSEYEREKLSPSGEGYRERTHSAASSAPDYSRDPLPSAPSDVKAFHHSLPEMGFYGHEKDPFDDEVNLHESLPDLALSKHVSFGEKKAARDIEPIPLRDIRIPGRGSLKSTGEDTPLKKPPQAPSLDEMQASSSSSGRSSSGQISKDLMECLDKMTYHSIADDNPFEPIPLAPQQETANAATKKGSAAGRAAGHFQNPMVDDSERDEFAEG